MSVGENTDFAWHNIREIAALPRYENQSLKLTITVEYDLNRTMCVDWSWWEEMVLDSAGCSFVFEHLQYQPKAFYDDIFSFQLNRLINRKWVIVLTILFIEHSSINVTNNDATTGTNVHITGPLWEICNSHRYPPLTKSQVYGAVIC